MEHGIGHVIPFKNYCPVLEAARDRVTIRLGIYTLIANI